MTPFELLLKDWDHKSVQGCYSDIQTRKLKLPSAVYDSPYVFADYLSRKGNPNARISEHSQMKVAVPPLALSQDITRV